MTKTNFLISRKIFRISSTGKTLAQLHKGKSLKKGGDKNNKEGRLKN